MGRQAQRDEKVGFFIDSRRADWNNSPIVRGDLAPEVTKLKQEQGQDLLVWGHGLLAESLLNRHLTDVLDLSIHPIIAGRGKLFFRDGENVKLKLVAAKSFATIVKLTYEPQY